MTTSRNYKYGKHSCKAYKKTAGKGWEIGFSFAGKTIFTGNFIHSKEANAWWTKMNHECNKFLRQYALPPKASTTFFTRFMSNYMYKSYYAWLDREFTKHTRTFTQACKKDERKYTHMKKHSHLTHWERPTLRRAA